MVTPELNFGGVETAVENRATALREVGFEIEAACFHKFGEIGERLKRQNFTIYDLNSSPRIPNFGIVKKLIGLFRQTAPDVVHSSCVEANFHCLLAARLAGTKIKLLAEEVGTLTNGAGEPTRSWKARKIAQMIWRGADQILAISEAVKQDVVRLEKADAAKVTVIPYYIDFDRFSFAVSEEKRSGREFVVGSIGRFSPEKGQKILLKAFRLVSRKNENVKLWLVGDGAERETLQTLARELEISRRVEFLGMRSDIPELLRQMDLLVQSSHYEGLGIAIQEAMASGVPVVASRIGGIPELIDEGETGVMFPVGDEAALAAEITKMIELDDEKREQLIRRARQSVEQRFSKTTIVNKLSDLYLKTFESR